MNVAGTSLYTPLLDQPVPFFRVGAERKQNARILSSPRLFTTSMMPPCEAPRIPQSRARGCPLAPIRQPVPIHEWPRRGLLGNRAPYNQRYHCNRHSNASTANNSSHESMAAETLKNETIIESKKRAGIVRLRAR